MLNERELYQFCVAIVATCAGLHLRLDTEASVQVCARGRGGSTSEGSAHELAWEALVYFDASGAVAGPRAFGVLSCSFLFDGCVGVLLVIVIAEKHLSGWIMQRFDTCS